MDKILDQRLDNIELGVLEKWSDILIADTYDVTNMVRKENN